MNPENSNITIAIAIAIAISTTIIIPILCIRLFSPINQSMDTDDNIPHSPSPSQHIERAPVSKKVAEDDDDDCFPTELPAPPPMRRLQKKSSGVKDDHMSFRHRAKKEMEHKSFNYKQVSDEATPTAQRKQLYSKRSACK